MGEFSLCHCGPRRGGLIVRDPRSTIAFTMNDQTPFIGRSMTRREDRRLLTGRGQYIADLDLPHMLHAVFVRSAQAHARIKAIDMSRAAAAPGVAFVLTGLELARVLPPVSDTQVVLPSKWTALVQHKFINPQQPLLRSEEHTSELQ